jgi:multiple sugar transport system substrate-binding protein
MFLTRSLVAILIILNVIACRESRSDDGAITFWASNNPEEISFIESYAEKWNAGQKLPRVSVMPIPEGQSSEEIILAAVVGKTTPDIYANMWQGEVEDYARAGVLVPLDTIPGFLKFMTARCGEAVMEEITSSDGHIYQVPWKVNPIMMIYNKAMIRNSGLDSLSTSYSEFIQAGATVSEDRNGDGYYDVWLGNTEVSPIWWQRLFNFVPLYYAATDGAPIVENEKAAFNNEAGIAVFHFLQTLYKNGYFPKEQMKGQSDPFLAQKIAMKFTGPWTIRQIEHFQATELDYAFLPMPSPDPKTGPTYTYCDPKNIVVFNTCDKPVKAWEFIKTLVSAEGDRDFLEISSQLPRRTDLSTNTVFSTFFERNPNMRPFAEQAKYLRGIDSNPYMKEVLDLISQEYEACVVFNKKSAEDAIRDAAEAVDLLYLK